MLKRLKDNAGIAALVIAVVALFVALSGIAGALPGKNKVNSGDIKNNSVKSADVKNDSLTGSDVNEGTLKLPSTAVAKSTFGVNAQANDTVTATTLPGVTVTGSGGGMTVNFPRSMKGCGLGWKHPRHRGQDQPAHRARPGESGLCHVRRRGQLRVQPGRHLLSEDRQRY
jgi:hypothetical protein